MQQIMNVKQTQNIHIYLQPDANPETIVTVVMNEKNEYTSQMKLKTE